jgi:hypothetical protein
MNFKKYLWACVAAVLAVFFVCGKSVAQQKKADYTKYYVSNGGDDNNPGTIDAPFRTIQKINGLNFKPGTWVYFKGGDTFKGTLIIGVDKAGTKKSPVVICSYGKDMAIISADSTLAVSVYKTNYVFVLDLKLRGLGRKTGSRENGIAILNSEHIEASILDISGFQKSGLLIDSSSHVKCEHVFVHDNGSAGITVEGRTKKDSRNIYIFGCRAENNPGDPTKLDNHSGNGIVVGHCTNVVIDACTATNNGWDMPRIGNGPVGIWCYEADSVLIQNCLSYNNKTSKGGADGGGFDFDGGTTNSIIEYCYSYGNQGSGYCIFQYWGASPFHGNIIRNNISYNDGTVSDSQAGLYVWNSSGDAKQFYNCKVYDNIIYNSKVAVISFSETSANNGFDFYHNIFVGKDVLIRGRDSLGKCVFTGNDWWSLTSGFNIDGIKNLNAWSAKTGKEQKNGKLTGMNIDPRFKNPDITKLTDCNQMKAFIGYQFSKTSALKKRFGNDLAQTRRSDTMY